LLIARRVVLLPPKDIPYRSLATCIHDRTDHIFFRVAAASKSKVLVSHDFDVHPVQGSRQKRDLERLCRAEAVRIVDAAEAFLLF
jgi:predicted nucleic acid-binding protein